MNVEKDECLIDGGKAANAMRRRPHRDLILNAFWDAQLVQCRQRIMSI